MHETSSLCPLAGDENLRGQFHIWQPRRRHDPRHDDRCRPCSLTTDRNARAPFRPPPRRFRASALQPGQLLLQNSPRAGSVARPALPPASWRRRPPVWRGQPRFARLGLLHQLDFMVLDFGDVGFARVNFMGEGAYSSFLRVCNCWLAYFSICVFFSWTSSSSRLRSVSVCCQGLWRLRVADCVAAARRGRFRVRRDVGQVPARRGEYSVAVLQNQKFLNRSPALNCGD